MLDKIISVISKGNGKSDDDFVDRMNYLYTGGMLALCSLVISWYTAFGDVIQCWTPTYFAGAWIDYTNNLCFVKNTYYLPMSMPVEEGKSANMAYSISYYQWIPLFFLMLALCFYIPRAIWFNVFAHHFVDINAIVELLTSFDNAVNPETRDPAVKQVAFHINRYLNNSVEYRKNSFFEARSNLARSKTFVLYMGRRYGLAITLVYLTIKVCYIAVAVCQIYWIDTFLQGQRIPKDYNIIDYYREIFGTSYVLRVLRNLGNGSNWENSPTFPRVTLCDFEVRALGQNQNFTVQCVLPINLFNEKIFLFLWIWICGVCVMTIINTFVWLFRLSFQYSRRHYIMKHLKLMGKLDEANADYHVLITNKMSAFFIDDYLRPDGIFLVRLISINTNCLIASEIISSLWEIFLEEEKVKEMIDRLYAKYRKKGLIKEEDKRERDGTATGSAGNIESDQTSNHSSHQPVQITRSRSSNKRQFSIYPPSIAEDGVYSVDKSSDMYQYQYSREPRRTYPTQQMPPQKVAFRDGTRLTNRNEKNKHKKGGLLECFSPVESAPEDSGLQGVTVLPCSNDEQDPKSLSRVLASDTDSDNVQPGEQKKKHKKTKKINKSRRAMSWMRSCAGGSSPAGSDEDEEEEGDEGNSGRSSVNQEHKQDLYNKQNGGGGTPSPGHHPARGVLPRPQQHVQPPAYTAIALDPSNQRRTVNSPLRPTSFA